MMQLRAGDTDDVVRGSGAREEMGWRGEGGGGEREGEMGWKGGREEGGREGGRAGRGREGVSEGGVDVGERGKVMCVRRRESNK
jgi:hypothetical protein